MSHLYNNDLYSSYLDLRDNIQEIMIGYSDSTKDVGIMESNYRLVSAQLALEKITRENGNKIRIFHGRGGSVSRGGGPTNRAILSLPPGTVWNLKITEQGEVIGQNYANREIAQGHLEGIISAMIVRGTADKYLEGEKNPSHIKPDDLEAMASLGNRARMTYEKMVKENRENFIPFYTNYTPLDLIERATIGSRPSRRTKDDVSDITALRAIPWIFSWTQTRLIFPGYYGLGTALEAIKEEEGLNRLKQLYHDFDYFESLINNIQMVMLKADMDIAELYTALLPEEHQDLTELFEQIREEYYRTEKLIFELTDNDNLMSNSPDIRNSIQRRNPYMDPLSVIQVILMKEWRDTGRSDNMDDHDSLQRLLLKTINGIAAGLKNTG